MLDGLKSLYICYFGLREPLVQTQVLPYLGELAEGGVQVTLLTFEPEAPEGWKEEAAQDGPLTPEGVLWEQLPYHKRPSVPATLYDIFRGAIRVLRIVRGNSVEIVHARAHIPLAIALAARRFTKFSLIFDIRGLMAEEYADAGIWSEGSLPYRMVKRLESAGLKEADMIVVLTESAKRHLCSELGVDPEKVAVIPCCVDTALIDTSEHGTEATGYELVYAGSVTGLYLLEEMVDFFFELKSLRQNAFFRVLTKGDRSLVEEVFRKKGVAPEDFKVESVRPGEVIERMRRARLGISFRKPTFSQIAASPTKIPEYLLAGLPVVTNEGIGDSDEMLLGNRVGVVVRDFSAGSLADAAKQAVELSEMKDVGDRCATVAEREFSLAAVGGPRYREVYAKIAESRKGEARK